MDFNSLMKLAKGNVDKINAQTGSSALLQTRLSPPRKLVKTKIDPKVLERARARNNSEAVNNLHTKSKKPEPSSVLEQPKRKHETERKQNSSDRKKSKTSATPKVHSSKLSQEKLVVKSKKEEIDPSRKLKEQRETPRHTSGNHVSGSKQRTSGNHSSGSKQHTSSGNHSSGSKQHTSSGKPVSGSKQHTSSGKPVSGSKQHISSGNRVSGSKQRISLVNHVSGSKQQTSSGKSVSGSKQSEVKAEKKPQAAKSQEIKSKKTRPSNAPPPLSFKETMDIAARKAAGEKIPPPSKNRDMSGKPGKEGGKEGKGDGKEERKRDAQKIKTPDEQKWVSLERLTENKPSSNGLSKMSSLPKGKGSAADKAELKAKKTYIPSQNQKSLARNPFTTSKPQGPSSSKLSTPKHPAAKPLDNKASRGPASTEKKASGNDQHLSTWDRLYQHTAKAKKRPAFFESDEEEEDDDMDDFIDDGDAGGYGTDQVSQCIKDIFKYDKSKFKDEDDFDDRKMVAGYSDIMKEEARSARLGRLEDAEDVKDEEEYYRKKNLKKQKRKKI